MWGNLSDVKAWLKLGHTTGQITYMPQQIYSRMAVKEKNKAFAIAW